MVDTGLTFEEQQLQARHFIQKLNRPLKELDRKGLEEEITKFLKKLQCLLIPVDTPM